MIRPGHDADLDLARRCAEGCPEAISGLVTLHGAFLARVASRILDATSAEDAVGEVFLRLLERRGALLRAYRGESSLRAYLAGVARRVALELRRKQGWMTSLPGEEPTASPPEDSGIREAMSRMAERDRKVLTLRYVEGLSFRELSARLGVPPGTAATWVARARERLQSEMIE